MVITEGAVLGEKKSQCYGKQRRGGSARRQERTKMPASQGIFFCDSFSISVMSVKVMPSVYGKMELFFCSTQRPKIIILMFTLVLLLINRAISELPDVLLCEMAD